MVLAPCGAVRNGAVSFEKSKEHELYNNCEGGYDILSQDGDFNTYTPMTPLEDLFSCKEDNRIRQYQGRVVTRQRQFLKQYNRHLNSVCTASRLQTEGCSKHTLDHSLANSFLCLTSACDCCSVGEAEGNGIFAADHRVKVVAVEVGLLWPACGERFI